MTRLRAAVLAVGMVVTAVAVAPAAHASGQAESAVDVTRDVQYGVANGKALLLDAYVPRATGGRARPAVILIHGGGFRAGDKRSFEPEAGKIANKGWVAFSINYRLDEPSAFPAEVDDAQAAVRWVRANAAQYGVNPERIGALGESAGGHLAAMLATLGTGTRQQGARIRVAVTWSAPLDLVALAKLRGDGWSTPLFGCPLSTCEDRYAQASPTSHVDSTDPAMFLINSTDELVPITQTRAMVQRLEDEQVPFQLRIVDGTRHALDYRDEVWNSTELYLQKVLDPSPVTSPGTVAFAATVLVVAALAGLLLVRRASKATKQRKPAAGTGAPGPERAPQRVDGR